MTTTTANRPTYARGIVVALYRAKAVACYRGGVVALYRGKVVTWWRVSVAKRRARAGPRARGPTCGRGKLASCFGEPGLSGELAS